MKQIETVKEFAQEVRALIEKGWLQGWYAEDEKGEHVSYASSRACKFCLMGAIYRLQFESVLGLSERFMALLTPIVRAKANTSYIHGFNDDDKTTKELVLEVLDEAIAKAA